MSRGSHDLAHLPAWGPYGKIYAGAAHIPDPASGMRLDLAVVPGLYRGRREVPNVRWDGSWRTAAAAADLSWWRTVHRIDGEAVRIEVDYAGWRADGLAALAVRLRCVNGAVHGQAFACSLALAAQAPQRAAGERCAQPSGDLVPNAVRIAEGGAWTPCIDHIAKHPARRGPRDTLLYDGWPWRSCAADGACGGRAVALEEAGDGITVALDLPRALADARIVLRLRAGAGAAIALVLDAALAGSATANGTGAWMQLTLAAGAVPAGVSRWRVLHAGPPGRVELDLLAALPAGGVLEVAERPHDPQPSIAHGPVPGSRIISWPGLPLAYGLRWHAPHARLRTWRIDRLDGALRERAHDHTSDELRGGRPGHWTELLMEPLAAAAGGTADAWAAVVHGPADAVARALAGCSAGRIADAVAAGAQAACSLPGIPAGDAHRAGAEALAACTLSNIAYPLWIRGGYARHRGPGKWWDSVYTWDAGFIGLGLAACSTDEAWACLMQYLMPEDDADCAFLHHGTPLPVQVHLAQVLWNRGRDRGRLARAFPGLRQMHRFLCGRLGSSDTARLPSGLLSTFSYFYNSGGWDDYPAQLEVHRQGLADRCAPMVNTSHAIASARMLAAMADLLGEDRAEFDSDAVRLAEAVQRHAWDEQAGVFGYVVHDGPRTGLLRDDGGVNLNLGLDGCSPLVAGICTPEQERRILGLITAEDGLLAPAGLTTVARRAPYRREDGYWNGATWFAHGWFFWRALLDLGHGDLAWEIARRGLEAWSREVAASGNCCEHFPDLSGRGAGWHHFSGLSCPILDWHAAYFRPGRVTGGSRCWVLDLQEGPAGLAAELRLDGEPGRSATVLAVAAPGARGVRFAGRPASACERHPGCWEVTLPADARGLLEIV